jgi:hypothetical protein
LNTPKPWLHGPIKRRDVVAIPILWLALLLSVHFHAAMLWFWLPQLPHPSLDEINPGTAATVLVTRLVPTPSVATVPESPPPSPPPAAAAPAARRAPSRVAPVRPPPVPPRAPATSPPIVAPAPVPVERPSPPDAPPPVAAPTPPRPQPDGDLASYIEARRRARGDPQTITGQGVASNAPAAETESQRKDRIIAANLAASREQPTFGYDPKSGGGVFQLTHVGYDYAEFYFTGWNKDIGRRAKQLIEVRKGDNSDIHLAVVRAMIGIIRAEVQGDFTWRSERMGQPVVMSARPSDNAALEAFLIQEFFSGPVRPR